MESCLFTFGSVSFPLQKSTCSTHKWILTYLDLFCLEALCSVCSPPSPFSSSITFANQHKQNFSFLFQVCCEFKSSFFAFLVSFLFVISQWQLHSSLHWKSMWTVFCYSYHSCYGVDSRFAQS